MLAAGAEEKTPLIVRSWIIHHKGTMSGMNTFLKTSFAVGMIGQEMASERDKQEKKEHRSEK